MSYRTKSRRGAAAHLRIIDRPLDPMARLGSKVKPMPNGCWAFNGNLDTYGQFDGMGAHRWVWQALNGRVPDGHHIHHDCEHKGCVNPAHLRSLHRDDHMAHHGHTDFISRG